MNAAPSLDSLRADLEAVQAAIAASQDAPIAEQALQHRDAVYLALDLGDASAAMRHALTCLELARALSDLSLQARAHVALALVLAETYDDLGAATHFAEADRLTHTARDSRGVAMVAVNASHHEMDRRRFGTALRRLHTLLISEHVGGLDLIDPVALRQIFQVNYVISAVQALAGGEVPSHWVSAVRRQLERCVQALRQLSRQREKLCQPLLLLEVFEALAQHALWRGAADEALALASEHVRLADHSGSALLAGRAWLERSRVRAQQAQQDGAIADAETAVQRFEATGHEVWLARAREALAGAYAGAGRFQEAFAAQREVTRGVEALYAALYQQRALVGQVEQQVHDAEVRAAALAEAARTDPLTGVSNRSAALETLTRLHRRAGEGHASAVALLDLDHFKRVNDSFGHGVGDAVLVRVARTLTEALRAGDHLARFGGEEFLLIFEGAGVEAARRTCERLRVLLEQLAWDDVASGLRTSASFGVAGLDGHADLSVTLRAADGALYAAKAAGRNAVRLSGDETLWLPLASRRSPS